MRFSFLKRKRWLFGGGLWAGLVLLGSAVGAFAAEPDPKTYWNVNDIRPGMKGTGRTVMVGTKLEEFGVEVLGVMRDVARVATWCCAGSPAATSSTPGSSRG